MRQGSGDRLRLARRRLVVAPAKDEGRRLDLAEPRRHVPAGEDAGRERLARPPHRVVDLVVRRAQRLLEKRRPRVEPAEVPVEERLHRLLVLGIVGGAGRLVPVQHLPDLERQLGAEAQRLLAPERGARQRRREDEALEALRLRERVLERKHPSPRMAEQMDPVEAQRVAQVGELREEELHRPERRIRRLRRSLRTELVVEDEPPLVGERLEEAHAAARAARAAVQEHERQPAAFPDSPVPGLVAPERDPPLVDARAHSGVTYAAESPPSTTNVAAFT